LNANDSMSDVNKKVVKLVALPPLESFELPLRLGQTFVGRRPELKIPDKRISRNQLEILVASSSKSTSVYVTAV